MHAITNFAIVSFSGASPQMRYIPLNNFFLEWMYNMLLLPLIVAFIGFCMGYVLSPLMLFFHKKIVGRKYKFGFYDQVESKGYKRIFLKGVFPVLMAMNLAVGYSEDLSVRAFMVITTPIEGISAGMNTFLYLIPLMLIFSMVLFSSVWFLEDVGIVYTNSERINMGTIEVKSVSGYFINILKGYTGITTIIVLGQLLIEFTIYSISSGYYGHLMLILTYPLLPLSFSIIISPIFKLLEATKVKRKEFLLKRAKKLGISETINVKIE